MYRVRIRIRNKSKDENKSKNENDDDDDDDAIHKTAIRPYTHTRSHTPHTTHHTHFSIAARATDLTGGGNENC